MLFRLFLSVFIYLSLSMSVHAAECRATFVDGLTNSHKKGKIKFKENAQLLNNPDRILASKKKIEDKDSKVFTCVSGDCSKSGSIVPQFTGSYDSYESDTDLKVETDLTITKNDYKDVVVEPKATLTMSADFTSFHFSILKMEEGSTVKLTAGDYYLEKLELKKASKLIVIGPGTARIYVKEEAKFLETSVSNGGESGDPSKLVIYSFGKEMIFEKTASFSGYLYSEKKVELKDSSKVFGAISAKGDIQLEGNSSVTYDDAIDDTDFGNMCGPLPPVVVDPILEYRFDECSYTGVAGDVIDQSGNFHGKSNGIPDPINEAVINKSLDLSVDDTLDWINVPSSAVDGLNDFSVSVWFKTAVNKNQQEIFHALGGDDWGDDEDELEIFLRKGKDWRDDDIVYIKVKGEKKEIDSNIKLTNNTWHHLVLTREAYSVCLFIDGVLQQCVSVEDADALSVNRTNAVIIGQEQDDFGGDFNKDQNFEGQLDEFKIFDEKLSPTQITSIFNNERAGRNYDDPVNKRAPEFCSIPMPELEYRFDEANWNDTANEVIDSSANNNHGRAKNSLTTLDLAPAIPGSLGTCSYGEFDGTGDYVAMANPDSLNFSGEITLAAWIRPDNTTGLRNIISHGHRTLPNQEIIFRINNGKYQVGSWNGSDHITSSSISASDIGNWVHLAGTYDGTTWRLYRNGVELSSKADSTGAIEVLDNWAIGARGNGQERFFDGGIDEPRIYSKALSQSQIEILMNEKRTCPTISIHHYEIQHDGQGLTCEPESIMVKACTNADCSSVSTEEIEVTVTATGSKDSVTDTISFTGTGEASIPYTFVGLTRLTLSEAGSNPTVCAGASGNSCIMTFAEAGFRFISGAGNSTTVPNQISGSEFSDALKIQAVKDTNGVCTGLFKNAKSVNLWQENVDPGGTNGLRFNVDGNPLAKRANVTNTSLTFGANSIATIPTPVYQDAGQIRLHADYDDGTVQLTGSSNPFWVSPDRLAVIAKSGSINLDGSTAAAITTHKAGEDFDLIVSAYNANNVITPNYSPGQMQLKLERTGPTLADSLDGNFSYAAASTLQSSTSPAFASVSLANFVSGVSTYSEAKYSEVGLLNLDIQDSNYGHVGITVDSAAIDIGRFTPDHFKQTVAEHGELFTTCGAGSAFAYTGQTDALNPNIGAISYENQPIIEITAYNKQSAITRNYDGDFIKLSAGDVSVVAPTFDAVNNSSLVANIDTGILSQTDLTALSSGTALAKGVLHYQLSALDHFVYSRGSGTEVAPYTSAFELAVDTISDADSIDLLPSDGSARTATAAIPNGVEVRFGRLVLQNSFGPTAVNLTQPLQVEYFNGSNFVVSSDDNCLGYEDSRLSSSPDIDALGGTGIFIDGETRSIQLDGQDTDSSGEIRVSYDTYDWLKYDWDNGGDYNDNPSAIATFGLFRGNDRVIYRRVVN